MAQRSRTAEEWEADGRSAIMTILGDRLVAPWHEIEARVTTGWEGLPRVQPLQLTAARRQLVESGTIVLEQTEHDPPVVTVRLPFSQGDKRQIERERGRRRKAYRKYLSWVMDEARCGRAGERAALATMQAAASKAGLYVPEQPLGDIDTVGPLTLRERGPLDAYAYILDLDATPPQVEVPLVVEVKNVHEWLYPWDRRVWMLLTKAAELAVQGPVVPLLACPSAAWITLLMAKDVGFFVGTFGRQLFSPTLIDKEEFGLVVDEFGLVIDQDEGPQEGLGSVLKKLLRSNPPPPPPDDEDVPFYRRQASRFTVMAPHIADFDSLAGNLDDDARREVYSAFKARVRGAAEWKLGGGW